MIEQHSTGGRCVYLTPGAQLLGGEFMSKCEICNAAEAKYEAVFAMPTSYKIKHVCRICVYEENRVTSPVEILDTSFSRE
jgi:hypothetical protein